ncbi:MAG: hypothetical protein ACPGSD_13435 [Flavobacteriales bacterium]
MEITENITQLTNPKLDLNSITILGIKLGESIENLPLEFTLEDPYCGWIHTSKGITIRISEKEPKKIVEFVLKSELLEDLNLTSKESIENRFGHTKSKEQQQGSTYYFYEDQGLVIAWENSSNKVFGIYIGENKIKQTKFSVVDFLKKFYEFKGMVPDHSKWNVRSLRYNEPRYYRLKELESLMRAFEFGNDLLEDFQNLSFLNKRSVEDFRPLLNDIEKYANNNSSEKERWKKELERSTDLPRLRMLIKSFMKFSEEMRCLLRFNSGWLMASSVTSRYSINKTQNILNNIDLTELNELESLLNTLLDPYERVYTKSELIEKFDFPDVDLDAIDNDNF